MEPLFKATTPDGRFSVTVLVPEGAEEAEAILFKCSVTLDEKDVIEELETNDQDKMLSWMKRQMTEAMRRTETPKGEDSGLDSNRPG